MHIARALTASVFSSKNFLTFLKKERGKKRGYLHRQSLVAFSLTLLLDNVSNDYTSIFIFFFFHRPLPLLYTHNVALIYNYEERKFFHFFPPSSTTLYSVQILEALLRLRSTLMHHAFLMQYCLRTCIYSVHSFQTWWALKKYEMRFKKKKKREEVTLYVLNFYN